MVTVVRIGILAISAFASSAFAQLNLQEISWVGQTVSGVQVRTQPIPNLRTATAEEHPSRDADARLSALEVAPGYLVAQIPYSGGRFAWIDNDVILFAGAPHPKSESELGQSQIALYQWRLASRTVTKIGDLGDAPDVCYDRGHLYVAFNRGDERVIRQGPMGQLEEVVVIRKNRWPFAGDFNRYDCKFRERPSATRPERRVITVLREDHGFIEIETGAPANTKARWFLIRPNKEEVAIDVPCRAGGPLYVEFVPGYVFQDGSSFTSTKLPQRICVLAANGLVSNYPLPAGQWLAGTVYGAPVRTGTLMISLAMRAKADGVYLIDPRGIRKIVSGYVSGYPTQFAVSPNGCKVAVSISPSDHDWGRPAVLNVCTSGG